MKAKRTRKFTNITGQQIGCQTVLAFVGFAPNNGGSLWLCQCDCGNVRVYLRVRLGKKSCAKCLDRTTGKRKTHGLSHTKSFKVWMSMRQRCELPTWPAFERYGGRGIRLCERWQKFKNFFADMGEAPEGKSIERIDNNGNYEPSNCRWATRTEQQRNTRKTRRITWNGQTKALGDWADELGLPLLVLYGRLSLGWSVERAFTEPVHNYNQLITFNGQSFSVIQWAALIGIGENAMRQRLAHWPVDRALTQPAKKDVRRIATVENF